MPNSSHVLSQAAASRARGRFGAARSEAGFTLIELLVAMLVLSIGIAALLTVLASSRGLVNDTERRSAALHLAEREIEDIVSMPNSAIALVGIPGGSTDPYQPNYYVAGNEYQPNHLNGSTATLEPLVAGGTLPNTSTWNDGRLNGVIHRYVTTATVAPGQTLKRVTVAVTVVGGQRRVKPAVLSALVSP